MFLSLSLTMVIGFSFYTQSHTHLANLVEIGKLKKYLGSGCVTAQL